MTEQHELDRQYRQGVRDCIAVLGKSQSNMLTVAATLARSQGSPRKSQNTIVLECANVLARNLKIQHDSLQGLLEVEPGWFVAEG